MDESNILLQEVLKAAEHGAKYAAYGRADIIEETKSEIALRWRQSIHAGRPPIKPKDWAFICAKNHASRILKEGARYISISDEIAEFFISPSEESALIQRIDSPATHWLRAPDAIAAINTLIGIATRIMNETGDPIDRQIITLHYQNHWTFERIAEAINMREDAARRRWSRMIFAVTDSIIEAVKADEKLAKVFAAILEDKDDFRTSILGLLSIVSRKGVSVLHGAIESILPA